MPAARRSNSDATITILLARAVSDSSSVVGPGIGSARSNFAWSSDWQKYWLRNSSGRQTSVAPCWAASTMRARARHRLSSGSAEQRICTRPILNVLGAATGCLLLHERKDVAEQPVPDRHRGRVVALRVGEDARATLGAQRAAHVVRVLADPGRDCLALQLGVELQTERASDAKGLVAAGR